MGSSPATKKTSRVLLTFLLPLLGIAVLGNGVAYSLLTSLHNYQWESFASSPRFVSVHQNILKERKSIHHDVVVVDQETTRPLPTSTKKSSLSIGWREQQNLFYTIHRERMNTLVNESTILDWKSREKSRAFDPLLWEFGLSTTEEDHNTSIIQQPGIYAAGDICSYAKSFVFGKRKSLVSPYVLFLTPFQENWGMLSTNIANRTAEHWNLTEHWRLHGCSRTMIIRDFLNRDKSLRAVVTVQFQDLDHPKVISIPLGVLDRQVPPLLQAIHRDNNDNSNQRSKLLMVNSRPRKMRTHVLDTVLRNFPGVRNTYARTTRGADHYFRELQQSKFILSPGGLGLDCYRHWEALYMGTIPVLEHLNRTDGWFRTFLDLPVAWIDSYDNLTPEWLEQEYRRIVPLATTFRYEKLTKQYWIDLIRSHATVGS